MRRAAIRRRRSLQKSELKVRLNIIVVLGTLDENLWLFRLCQRKAKRFGAKLLTWQR